MLILTGTRRRERSADINEAKHRLISTKGIASLAIVFALILSITAATGDIMVAGNFKFTLNYEPPSIEINKTKVCYKATTFEWSTSVENNTTVGVLRVHVNFDHNNTSYFWNILALSNTGNTTGNITALITKEAKIGSYILNETYTSAISVYMNHQWQSSLNPGIELLNNTTSPKLPLYPSGQVSYYIGVVYQLPPDLPPWVISNLNSLGEYITFTFTFV